MGSFENAELIDDVKASLTISEESLRECMLRWIDDKTYLGADSNFEHGTIIKLNPTRESWYNRDFKRVNNSLNSINPLTTTDKFKVEVKINGIPDLIFLLMMKNLIEIDMIIK